MYKAAATADINPQITPGTGIINVEKLPLVNTEIVPVSARRRITAEVTRLRRVRNRRCTVTPHTNKSSGAAYCRSVADTASPFATAMKYANWTPPRATVPNNATSMRALGSVTILTSSEDPRLTMR